MDQSYFSYSALKGLVTELKVIYCLELLITCLCLFPPLHPRTLYDAQTLSLLTDEFAAFQSSVLG